jgi:hypothetical protein
VTVVRRWVATAVAVALLVAGCSDDPEPKFEPSPSPSQSESAAEPSEPMAWEVKSEKGAVAFAKHWIDVFNDAAATGETDELTAMTGPNCQTCKNFVGLIEDIYREDGQYNSDGWSVVHTSTANGLPAAKASVAMRVRQPAERITRPGRPVETHEPATVTYSAGLEWKDGEWKMDRLLFLS